MILKGNQRGGGRQMALHLLNGEQNEHVRVHQIRGFIADDVLGALNEAYAISKGTRCKQFMYSLSLSPPSDVNVPASVFEDTLRRIEEKLRLSGQPRVVVFHEKEGRRHAHCVWSRIDIDKMKAINMDHDRRKLNALSKTLYLEHGWKMPDGFKNKSRSNPLNFTRDQWQQAARIGRKAADIKRELQECWAVSDDRRSFEAALQENGYTLARGDRRGYVAVDYFGEVYSLSRQLETKKKDIQSRLGKPDALPSVEEAKAGMSKQLSPLFKRYADELAHHHKAQCETVLRQKRDMTERHRAEREKLENALKKRWQQEERDRASRVRKGFKGLWDKLSGRYWKIRKQNEQEAWSAHQRDQKLREEQVFAQLSQRQPLQEKITALHEQQDLERKALIRDLGRSMPDQPEQKTHSHIQDHTHEAEHPDIDIEPEI